MIKWTNARIKPTTPNDFLASSNSSFIRMFNFFNGPKEKLSVKRINAASEIPLFRIKKGTSFHGTSPTTL